MIPFFRKKQESEDYIEYAESHIESEPNIQSADHTQELVAMAEVIAKLKVEIEDWKRRSNEYCKKLFELQKKISDGASDQDLLNEMDVERLSPVVVNRYIENLAVKHSIVEDDNYCRIISQQDIFTISIRREFNTSKDNYNWVDEGSALITMYLDNIGRNMSRPTLIKAPVSGIYECDNNKLIKDGDEICRIKKYAASEKELVLERLEREDIKKAVLKRERKKMIERETMDELIAEGKVFNVVTAKNGNRMTIPMDVATAVWNRDGGCCCMCGAKSELEFDHIIPISKGGATTFRNLQLLCHSCNLMKSDSI